MTIIQDDGYWRFPIEIELISWPTVATRLMIIAYLFVEIIQRWSFSSAKPLHVTLHQGQGHRHEHDHMPISIPSCQCRHSYFSPGDITIIAHVTYTGQVWDAIAHDLEWRSTSSDWEIITCRPIDIVGLCSQQTALLEQPVSEINKRLLFSPLRSVWPWVKVKVNIINTWCILMSEAVTVRAKFDSGDDFTDW